MKHLFYISLLTLVLVGVTSCEDDPFPYQPQPGTVAKPVDTVYSSIWTMADDSGFLDFVEFMQTQTWKSEYHFNYSIQASGDTIYRKEITAGYRWDFLFNTVPGFEKYSGFLTQEVLSGEIGGRFVFKNDWLILDINDTFDIASPTRYMDSTYSFSLKQSYLVDSITRVSVIKLQSSN